MSLSGSCEFGVAHVGAEIGLPLRVHEYEWDVMQDSIKDGVADGKSSITVEE